MEMILEKDGVKKKIKGDKCQYRIYARAKNACKFCRASAVSTKFNVLTRDETIGLYLQGSEVANFL
jgi:hypothetical protein